MSLPSDSSEHDTLTYTPYKHINHLCFIYLILFTYYHVYLFLYLIPFMINLCVFLATRFPVPVRPSVTILDGRGSDFPQKAGAECTESKAPHLKSLANNHQLRTLSLVLAIRGCLDSTGCPTEHNRAIYTAGQTITKPQSHAILMGNSDILHDQRRALPQVRMVGAFASRIRIEIEQSIPSAAHLWGCSFPQSIWGRILRPVQIRRPDDSIFDLGFDQKPAERLTIERQANQQCASATGKLSIP